MRQSYYFGYCDRPEHTAKQIHLFFTLPIPAVLRSSTVNRVPIFPRPVPHGPLCEVTKRLSLLTVRARNLVRSRHFFFIRSNTPHKYIEIFFVERKCRWYKFIVLNKLYFWVILDYTVSFASFITFCLFPERIQCVVVKYFRKFNK